VTRPGVRLFLRSLLVQGAWNPRDLQGTGVAWILSEELPEGEGPEPFNAHPYLAGVALGALDRIRREGDLSPEAVRRFRSALRSPLGALGDALVWAGWLPALLLGAIFFLVADGATGGTAVNPLGLVAGFLLLHNVLHLWMRGWGIQMGLRHGKGVGLWLGRSPLRRWGDTARKAAVLLAGAAGGSAAVLAARVLPAPGFGGGSVAVGALALLGLGYLMAGRLPVTTPLRVAALLLAGGWLVATTGVGG
jgi:hypothetical protein